MCVCVPSLMSKQGDGGKEKLPEMVIGRNLERNQAQKGTHPHLGTSDCAIMNKSLLLLCTIWTNNAIVQPVNSSQFLQEVRLVKIYPLSTDGVLSTKLLVATAAPKPLQQSQSQAITVQLPICDPQAISTAPRWRHPQQSKQFFRPSIWGHP